MNCMVDAICFDNKQSNILVYKRVPPHIRIQVLAPAAVCIQIVTYNTVSLYA